MRRCVLSLLLSLAVVLPAVALAGRPLPLTPKRPVEDRYWGVAVTDDYRWLEEWSDPGVRAWSDSQNAVARAFLDSLPMRRAVLHRIESLTEKPRPNWFGLRRAGGIFFALESVPPKQQPILVSLRSLDDLATQEVLVDPNAIDPSGSTTIDFFVPSHDGAKVAVSLSQGGTESGTVFVWEVKSGRKLAEEIPRVNGGTAGGSLAWNGDGSGFWRTRYAAPGERPEKDLPFYQQLYFHRLGTPADSDRYVLGADFPKIAEIELSSSADGKWVLADVLNGDGGDHEQWLARQADGQFQRLSSFADRVVATDFGPGVLYLLSRADAPQGKVLRLSLEDPALEKATVMVPEGSTGIEGITASDGTLYVEEIAGGPSRVRVFTSAGETRGTVPLAENCAVFDLAPGGGGRAALGITSWIEPPRWVSYDPARHGLGRTALVTPSPASFADIEVRRVSATSRDGTRVPLTILLRKGTKLDGLAPTLLYGYGGFAISQRPSFSATRRVWFDQGGIYAVAHTRGGGEFGDAWHEGGKLTKKQNVFDDFFACAQWLADHHYTSPARLACEGGSNGGLLMGAMITQHPGSFRAVVSSVGIYDMLRSESGPNGQFNTTEYGSVADSVQFAALYAYSPYHHVVDGTKYPAVLFATGANDPRVDPMQSRKMTARLQAANASGEPILLRAEAGTGHIGSPLKVRNELTADIDSFLLAELGVSYHEPAPARFGAKPGAPHAGRR
jgi:prolyl oligopeptidase